MFIETKLSIEKVENGSVCHWTCEGLCFFFSIFDERHVTVVGIELWMSP